MFVVTEDAIRCTAFQASDDRMTSRLEGSGSHVHDERMILHHSVLTRSMR